MSIIMVLQNEIMGPVPKPLHELDEASLEKKRETAKVTSATLRYLTEYLSAQGFEWMLPVILSKTTDPLWPDPGASIEKRLEFEVYGETVRTTQSMIIHKLVSSSLLAPKIFVVSPNIRIEKRERGATGRHAYEFTQLDFEIRGGTFAGVKSLVEGAVVGLIKSLKKQKSEKSTLAGLSQLGTPKLPFQSFDSTKLQKKYGKDWESRLAGAISEPVWVTNIPREFYDFEDARTGKWENYDLFVPGYGEILSGAKREWEYSKILAKLERDGVRKENYRVILELAKDGRLRPSAGAGIGIERLIGWMLGAEHVGEIQPFPRVPGTVYDL